MKQGYLCLNLIFLPFFAFTQSPFNFVSSQLHGKFLAIDVNDSGRLIAVGSHESCPEGYAVFLDTAGSIVWEKEFEIYLSPATDVFFDREENIVVVGTVSTADDVGSEEDGMYLLKLDSLGNTLVSTNIASDFYLGKTVHAIELSDTNILAAVDNDLFWFNSAGDSLHTLEIGTEEIIDLETGPNGSILVLTKNTAIWLNESGEILDQRSASSGFVAACTKVDTSWIIDDVELLRFAGSLSDPDIFNFVASISPPSGIACFENQEGVLLWDTSDHFYHHLYGSMSQLNYPLMANVTVRDVFATDQQIFMVGTQVWETPIIDYSLRGGFVQSLALDQDTMQYDLQLQLVDLSLSKPLDTIDIVDIDGLFYSYTVAGEFTGTITVVNLSNDTIENFVLFSERIGGFNCGQERYYQLVNDISVPPGEEVEVPVVFQDVATFSEEGMTDLNRCFYVAAPNNHFDPDLSNNSSCQTLISSIQEQINPELALRIVPNPANDHFLIQLEKDIPIRGFSIFDLSGRVQSVDHSIQFNQVAVNRSDLPAGMYIVYLQTASGLVTDKVVLR
jgi:hypothetical protein